MARAIRPLPSSKGWMETNQRWAMAALSTPSSRSLEALIQARKRAISVGSRSGAGAM